MENPFLISESLFSKIKENSEKRKAEIKGIEFKRYLFEKIKGISNSFFAGIVGLRGIGKSTLLLQLADEFENSLYIEADAPYLKGSELYYFLHFARSKGIENFFIDEIQYSNYWQQGLKTFYDENAFGKGIKLVFSGSSSIDIIRTSADLSRRALIYNLKPLSFREFLIVKKKQGEISAIPIEDILDEKKRHELITKTSKFNTFVEEYYKLGGLGFSIEPKETFYLAMKNTLDKIINNDLAYLRQMDLKLENDVFKILEFIAISPAGEVSYSNIANKIGLNKNTLIRIIDDLQKLGIVKRVLPCGKAGIRKEPKLYLAFPFREFFNDLTNNKSDLGALREEFFVNHVEKICYFKGERGQKTPDFLFQGKKFEIGGQGKNWKQNPDYIVKDFPTYEEKAIPLYLFGFLY